MRINILKTICVLTLFLFFTGCNESHDTSMLKEGDLVFQNKSSKNNELISILSPSKYNDMGILYKNSGKWYVLEAVQPVQLTPFKSWVKSGDNKHYVVKRLKEESSLITEETLKKMHDLSKEFLGRPYDFKFEWTDRAFYSSELVWKVFKSAFDIELANIQTLAHFNLSDAQIKQKIKEVYGTNVPLYEELVTPESVFNSNALIKIIEK